MDHVSSRDLICGQLRALRDNRSEAEQHLDDRLDGTQNAALPAADYRPGRYSMMDWVAARLHKTGSAAWAFMFAGQQLSLSTLEAEGLYGIEFECLSALELESLSTLAASLI